MTEAPYGSWRSPITADLITSASIGLSSPELHGDYIYWLESRPLEGGRNVVVRRGPGGKDEDLIPPPFNSRTRVHEYGGGDHVIADDGSVYFTNFADQRIYHVVPGETPQALTNIEGHRYADLVIDKRRSRIVCVREDHTRSDQEAVNTIAAISLADGSETVLVQGADFYSNPRLSPSDISLAWLEWNHPNMPWDQCKLVTAQIEASDELRTTREIGGYGSVSIFQPEWPDDGSIWYVTDRSGWWNLESWEPVEPGPSLRKDAEFGLPLWQFGASTYGFDSRHDIVCTFCEAGVWRLGRFKPWEQSETLTVIRSPYSVIRDLHVSGDTALFFGMTPQAPSALIKLDLKTEQFEVIKKTSDVELDPGYVSLPHAIEFPTEGGLTAHAFYFPPQNKDYEAPAGEKPPLIVMSHGGPTSATVAAFSLRIQYWTSRGLAVLDVNYGGSTGYGREYRERLNGKWGVVDMDDCVNGALYLVREGHVDGKRLAITGGSAGGYTTLCALTFRDVFSAGASHYGVGDLGALARDTHKFESRYLDGLVGPYPEREDLYRERSPIEHVDQLNTPVVFFQGLEDQIVPPNQAEAMVEALRAKGLPVAYVAFEGEQHGFRRAENIKRALDGELYFYSRIFGFELADPVEPLQIDNLP